MEKYLEKSAVMQAVFNALCANPRGLTSEQLVTFVYRGCKEPDWAVNSICVTCTRFNKKAREGRWSFRVRGTPGPGGKRQIWIVK